MEYDKEYDYTEDLEPDVIRFLKLNGFKRRWLSRHYVKPGDRSIRHRYWALGVTGSEGGVLVGTESACRFRLVDYDFKIVNCEEYGDRFELHEALGRLLADAREKGEENIRKQAAQAARSKSYDVMKTIANVLDPDGYRGDMIEAIRKAGHPALSERALDQIQDLLDTMKEVRSI